MNPCKDCLKVYGYALCSETKHCAFEGTDTTPLDDLEINLEYSVGQRQQVQV